MSHPPRKPSRRPKAPPPDPDLEVNDGRTHVFQGPRREDHLTPPPSLPKLPPPPRQRDRTPLSAVSAPPAPVPQPPISWRFPDGYRGEEAKTDPSAVELQVYGSLLGTFDRLSTQHRIDLAEVCGAFAAIGESGGRERFLALARQYGNASEATRTELLELVLLASEMTPAVRAALIRLARALPEREVEIDVAVVE